MLEIIAPAFLPALTDGIRGLFARFTGGRGAEPQNVEERLALQNADIERLKALAELDKAEGVSQWVANFRALVRPVAAITLVFAYVGATLLGSEMAVTLNLEQYAGMVTFYWFGDRAYSKTKSK